MKTNEVLKILLNDVKQGTLTKDQVKEILIVLGIMETKGAVKLNKINDNTFKAVKSGLIMIQGK